VKAVAQHMQFLWITTLPTPRLRLTIVRNLLDHKMTTRKE